MWAQVAGADVGIECVTNNNRQMRWVMTRRIDVLLFFFFFFSFFCLSSISHRTWHAFLLWNSNFCILHSILTCACRGDQANHTHTHTHFYPIDCVFPNENVCFTSGFNGIWMVTIADAHLPRTRSEKVDQHIFNVFFFLFLFSFLFLFVCCRCRCRCLRPKPKYFFFRFYYYTSLATAIDQFCFFFLSLHILQLCIYVQPIANADTNSHTHTHTPNNEITRHTVHLTLTLFSFLFLCFFFFFVIEIIHFYDISCIRRFSLATTQARVPIGVCACRRVVS